MHKLQKTLKIKFCRNLLSPIVILLTLEPRVLFHPKHTQDPLKLF